MSASASQSKNETVTTTSTSSYVDSFNSTVNRVNNIANSGNFYLAVGGSKSLLENMSGTVQGAAEGATETDGSGSGSKMLLYAIVAVIVALLIWRKVKGN